MHFFDNAAQHFMTIPWVQLSLTVWLLLALALIFDFLNGFHDAANSVATIVSTRVLSPFQAVMWAAFFNFIAFMVFHLKVAATMGKGIIDPGIVDNNVIAATLIAACAWDLITWYWGLPTSSSHALIGGMIGAALAKTAGLGALQWQGIRTTALFIILAPLIGMAIGFTIALVVTWLCRKQTPRRVDKVFRVGQLFSAAFYSLGHGGNDAQKTMGIIFVLLIAASQPVPKADMPVLATNAVSLATPLGGGPLATAAVLTTHHGMAFETPRDVPTEVVLACHIAMGFGTLFGGWRIVKTMGQRIIKLRPVDGFCAEGGAAATLLLTIFGGIPVSTTHTITGSILGVGSMKRFNAVRWGVAGQVVWAWILTIPAAAGIAAVSWWVLPRL